MGVQPRSSLGQMSTGGGHSQLQETMGFQMSLGSFSSTERDIGEWWRQELQKVMVEAGKEEKCLSKERGDHHKVAPPITVIVDAGWSKRSHCLSYNAKSGVDIITGQVTGNLLYIGVRSKYCSACTWGILMEQHNCYKNWEESSSQMEPDVILKGFKQAEEVHGLRYM